ncbi:MAG: hypothetical protein D6740_03395 [Alphaproteobacteria bacterium]|nr:MAG: hypothetical protein D6740_03395 [Alphaproteobacteria bacterium]
MRLRTAGVRFTAGTAGGEDALADPRIELRLRRARAWLEARCAGADLPESLLVDALHGQSMRPASPQAMAKARAIAPSLRRALEK